MLHLIKVPNVATLASGYVASMDIGCEFFKVICTLFSRSLIIEAPYVYQSSFFHNYI